MCTLLMSYFISENKCRCLSDTDGGRQCPATEILLCGLMALNVSVVSNNHHHPSWLGCDYVCSIRPFFLWNFLNQICHLTCNSAFHCFSWCLEQPSFGVDIHLKHLFSQDPWTADMLPTFFLMDSMILSVKGSLPVVVLWTKVNCLY